MTPFFHTAGHPTVNLRLCSSQLFSDFSARGSGFGRKLSSVISLHFQQAPVSKKSFGYASTDPST
jgi:hypothetical protein